VKNGQKWIKCCSISTPDGWRWVLLEDYIRDPTAFELYDEVLGGEMEEEKVERVHEKLGRIHGKRDFKQARLKSTAEKEKEILGDEKGLTKKRRVDESGKGKSEKGNVGKGKGMATGGSGYSSGSASAHLITTGSQTMGLAVFVDFVALADSAEYSGPPLPSQCSEPILPSDPGSSMNRYLDWVDELDLKRERMDPKGKEKEGGPRLLRTNGTGTRIGTVIGTEAQAERAVAVEARVTAAAGAEAAV
jgi:hypothetical protein